MKLFVVSSQCVCLNHYLQVSVSKARAIIVLAEDGNADQVQLNENNYVPVYLILILYVPYLLV